MIEILGIKVYFLAIIFATVANIIIGMLWYSPFLFGKIWQKLINKKDSEIQMKPQDMVYSIFVAFSMAIGLNSVIQFSMKVSELNLLINIFATAFMITTTFILPTMMNEFIWEGKNVKLILLNYLHQLVVYIGMGAIISLWL